MRSCSASDELVEQRIFQLRQSLVFILNLIDVIISGQIVCILIEFKLTYVKMFR